MAHLPISPHPRQAEFLTLQCEEALFGGAAGGGKTETLLMWLAEGVTIPGYNAAIFRRYAVDTEGDESTLKAKSARLYPALGGRLVDNRWIFPAGASISLHGIAHENSVLSQQGKEFHRVAFDELTHFLESMYNFIVTTRLRKVLNFPIWCGVRCSANPGGPGHQWVKDHFITNEAIAAVKRLDPTEETPIGMVFYKDAPLNTIAYVPSRAADNPSLDIEDYIRRLSRNKNPVERARMMNGDWGISPEGLIKPHWLRYYKLRGGTNDLLIELMVSRIDEHGTAVVTDEVMQVVNESACMRFITGDTAGGMKDITNTSKGKEASWTVFQVWDFVRFGAGKIGAKVKPNTPQNGTFEQALILRDVWRDRKGFTEVAQALVALNDQWKPREIKVENATMGPHLVSLLGGKIPISVIPIKAIPGDRGTDKVTRANPLLNMMEKGQVYLPLVNNDWRRTLETEWLGWQGIDGETNDQIDTAAYAALHIGAYFGNVMTLDFDPRKPMVESPHTILPFNSPSMPTFWQ